MRPRAEWLLRRFLRWAEDRTVAGPNALEGAHEHWVVVDRAREVEQLRREAYTELSAGRQWMTKRRDHVWQMFAGVDSAADRLLPLDLRDAGVGDYVIFRFRGRYSAHIVTGWDLTATEVKMVVDPELTRRNFDDMVFGRAV